MPNRLINETSPYLLQHAHNPVDWYAWGPEALEHAAQQDKLILLSIGYSACHWCHVMEHESFENETIAEIMNRNLTSVMLCSQRVATSMIERKSGAIINIVSIAGRTGGGPGAAAYSVAKGGLITFTKSLAKELAPHGVSVNAISPGVIDTPFHQVFSTPEMIRNFVTTIPLARLGTPLECAKVIAFLASDASSYIVGETIEVNGGQLML